MMVNKENGTKKVMHINSGKSINKLILLGNGFDLAHGLKTGYSDFINQYFEKVLCKLKNQEDFNDPFLSIKIKFFPQDLRDIVSNKTETFAEIITQIAKHPEASVIYNSSFFRKICNINQEKNWVDIEQEYYQEFILLFDAVKRTGNKNSTIYADNIKKLYRLNKDLEHLSTELKGYLKDCIKFSNENLLSRLESFFKELNENDLIINFNYTNTINEYFSFGTAARHLSKVITIHGNVGDNNYPLVFGFGDERDQMYQQIEDLNDNSLMDHFKSFAYFRNQNYSKLLSFIDSKPFEVHTIGLSCGLSDRTLLSQIFEHENCEKIHIQYYKDENGYQDVARNISRHFSDKQELRRKLVNFEDCEECPQIN